MRDDGRGQHLIRARAYYPRVSTPDHAHALEYVEAKAKELAQLGPTDAAEPINLQIISSFPLSLSAHRRLGKIYKDRGDTDLAVEAFERVLELAPGDSIARNPLERLYRGEAGPAPPMSTAPMHFAKQTTWAHDDLFPLVARAIDRSYLVHQDWVGTDVVRDELLHDPQARLQIEDAAHLQGKTSRTVAGNMVGWFSATFTKGTNPYVTRYGNELLAGKASYRPRRLAG